MISEKIKNIPDFPEKLAVDLKHCILAHHGELEYGSPKKPSIPEAFALNLADNCDAKMEMLTELILNNNPLQGSQWYGFNRGLDSNIRQSSLNQDKEFF
jgi:3'-5' exoribonuclease